MKQLVLLGGGHAQVQVLAELAARPLAGWAVHLVSPQRGPIYSGMLPGWVAGHYPIEACTIPLDALAARAGVRFHETAGLGLDFQANLLRCADGQALPFDALSVDTGSVAATLPGSPAHALSIRPIEAFVAAWPALVQRIVSAGRRFDLLVLGAGAAGIELAFAIQQRADCEAWTPLRLTVVGSEALPLPGAPWAVRRRIARLLVQRGIRWQGACRATRVDDGQLQVDGGPPLGFDACLACLGSAAPGWPAASGIETDARGCIRVLPTLQSRSHPQLFAAGDVAAHADPRPKSGVFAVRAGPTLAANLRAYCEGREGREGHALTAWQPPSRALYLISTGQGQAQAIWGGWSFSGRWVWRWKDRIDRRFMQRLGVTSPPSP